MTRPTTGTGLRRTTGALFVVGAVAFAAAATVLSSTFDWPDILREPAECGAAGLRRRRHQPGLDLVRHRLDLRDPGRPDPAAARRARAAATTRRCGWPPTVGATSVLLSLIGFLRWVFVVPPLAHSYVTGDPVTQAAVDAAWTAQHQFGGALLGEHLGQLLAIGWSVTLSVIILRSRVLPRWLGVTGLAVSALYLLNQGDILATAVPGFPVWDLAGLIGSTSWGLWVAALGVTAAARAPSAHPRSATDAEHATSPAASTRTPLATDRPRGAEHHDRLREQSRPSFLRTWLIWTAGFLAFPLAGLAGTAVAGRVDSPLAALLGGAVAGLVIGAGQALVSRRGSTRAGGSRPPRSAWASGSSSAPPSSATAPRSPTSP